MSDAALDLLRADARRQGLSEREYARRYGFDLGMAEAKSGSPAHKRRPELPIGAMAESDHPRAIAWGTGCAHPPNKVRPEEYRPGILRPFCDACGSFVG